MFLTYNGMLKVLFSSRSGNAEKFQDWASKILFTIQLGSVEQKNQLAGKLLGISPQVIKDVFNSNTNKTPSVYLFLIGKANVLIGSSYSENDYICKFGCTEDLARRTAEHERNFKKTYNTDIQLQLLCYSVVDEKYIFDAEGNLKQFFKANKLSENDISEQIIINMKELDSIKQHYKLIQNSYIGRYQEMYTKIQELEKKIITLQTEIQLKSKDTDNLILKHQIDVLEEKQKSNLLLKDIEILNLKLQLAKH